MNTYFAECLCDQVLVCHCNDRDSKEAKVLRD